MEINKIVHRIGLLHSTSSETPTSYVLCKEMIDALGANWKDPDLKCLDPSCGRGTFLLALVEKLQQYHSLEHIISNMVYGVDISKVQSAIARKALFLVADVEPNIYCEDSLEKEYDMKFDVIVGNPPYQDGSKSGSQNKIYNQICKKALSLLKPTGVLAFITPTSVLKKSKRFSLVGEPGLKHVDFTAGDHFAVGIDICSWIVDKTHGGDVSVKHAKGLDTVSGKNAIYDYGKVSKDFAKLYDALKQATNTPTKRMFAQNTVASSDRSETSTKIYQYPVCKVIDGNEVIVKYNRPVPKLQGKKKFAISRTKSFNSNAYILSNKDFDVAYMFTGIKNKQEVENIKSFLFSDHFVAHCGRWKQLDGYGFNDALIYLPPFDKTKSWTSEEVKEFLESFLDD